MKNQNDVATIKNQIEKAIQNENFDKVEELSKELCQIQGLDTEHEIPSDFVRTIKQKERKKQTMRMKNKVAKAAAVVIAVSAVGGSVYAASQHFKPVQQMGYGIAVGDNTANVEINETGGAVSLGDGDETLDAKTQQKMKAAQDKVREEMEAGADENVEVLETALPGNNDRWLSKKVERITSYGKASDDGINWRDEENVRTETTYEYQDLDTACVDQGMRKIFDKTYALKDNATYQYTEHLDEEGKINQKDATIDATLKYGKGTVDVRYSKVIPLENEKLSDYEDRQMLVITGEEKAFNQRTYTAKSGETYALSDNTSDGVTATTVVLSDDSYDCILTFTDLTEMQIHEILDTVIAE